MTHTDATHIDLYDEYYNMVHEQRIEQLENDLDDDLDNGWGAWPWPTDSRAQKLAEYGDLTARRANQRNTQAQRVMASLGDSRGAALRAAMYGAYYMVHDAC